MMKIDIHFALEFLKGVATAFVLAICVPFSLVFMPAGAMFILIYPLLSLLILIALLKHYRRTGRGAQALGSIFLMGGIVLLAIFNGAALASAVTALMDVIVGIWKG